MIGFGTRGLLGYISPIETFRLDQALVGLFLSPAALGLYVVGVSLTNLPRFLAQSVGMVAYPRIASTADPRHAYRLIWRYLLFALAVSAIIVVPLEVTAGVLIRFFFGDEFVGATSVARILLVGTIIVGLGRVLADGARGIGYPGAGSVAEFISWAALVPAAVLLLPLFGPEGVALALTISWFVGLTSLLAILIIVTDSRVRSRPETT